MSNILLPKNHYLPLLSSTINELCYPLFSTYQMNMFVYGKYYKDGSCILLSDNEKWMREHIANEYLVPAPMPLDILEKKESFHIIPREGRFQQAKYDLIQKYNCDQAVDFIIKGENYYEVICFAFPLGHHDVINVIVNNLDALKEFTFNFKEKAAHLLSCAEDNKIILPSNMMGIDFSKTHQLKNIEDDSDLLPRIGPKIINRASVAEKTPRKDVFFDYGKTSFSFREAQCLHYFLHHYSAKKTSEKLSISKKTVEYHLAKIKEKLNCYDMSQITNLAIEHGFIDLLFKDL